MQGAPPAVHGLILLLPGRLPASIRRLSSALGGAVLHRGVPGGRRSIGGPAVFKFPEDEAPDRGIRGLPDIADGMRIPLDRFPGSASLDELPRLFNVLAGSMSLVGPKPEMPSSSPADRAGRGAGSEKDPALQASTDDGVKGSSAA